MGLIKIARCLISNLKALARYVISNLKTIARCVKSNLKALERCDSKFFQCIKEERVGCLNENATTVERVYIIFLSEIYLLHI